MILSKFYKSVFILITFGFITNVNSVYADKVLKDKSSAKKKTTHLIQLDNPFDTSAIEPSMPGIKSTTDGSTNYSSRVLQQKNLSAINKKIQEYKLSIDRANERAAKKYAKKLASQKNASKKLKQLKPNKFTYSDLTYHKSGKKIVMHDVVDGSSGIYKDFEDRTTVKKVIDFLWFDLNHESPHYFMAEVHDDILINDSYLKTDMGKNIQSFISKLSTGSNSGKTISNDMLFAFDFDEKATLFNLAMSSQIENNLKVKAIIKTEGYTRLLHHSLLQIGGVEQSKAAEKFLPLISTLKMKELYIRVKLEKTLQEIIQALPQKEGKKISGEYENYKSITPEQWSQQFGALLSKKQAAMHKQSLINFFEQKKALVFRLQLEKPEPVTSIFTYFVLAKSNPKLVATMIGKMNISLVNE